ncbi:Hypothetical predicted protein, partial [Pelobates cultripes]
MQIHTEMCPGHQVATPARTRLPKTPTAPTSTQYWLNMTPLDPPHNYTNGGHENQEWEGGPEARERLTRAGGTLDA